jgi:hypothetical protein
MNGFLLIANRKNDYNRSVRDILGRYEDPQTALLSSKKIKEKFYKNDKNFISFELQMEKLPQDKEDMLYCVTINPASLNLPITVYTYPMDDVTAARYTGREVAALEYIVFAHDAWKAVAIATYLAKTKNGEKENTNGKEDAED